MLPIISLAVQAYYFKAFVICLKQTYLPGFKKIVLGSVHAREGAYIRKNQCHFESVRMKY